MDMMENDDKLVRSFFSEHPLQMSPDADFTRRVMRRLPQRSATTYRVYRVWTVACLVAVAVVFVWCHGAALVAQAVGNVLGDLEGCLASMRSTSTVATTLGAVALLIGSGLYFLFCSDGEPEM